MFSEYLLAFVLGGRLSVSFNESRQNKKIVINLLKVYKNEFK